MLDTFHLPQRPTYFRMHKFLMELPLNIMHSVVHLCIGRKKASYKNTTGFIEHFINLKSYIYLGKYLILSSLSMNLSLVICR